MSPRLRSDVPAVAGGVLAVLVTAGLPVGWRAGLALAVAGLLAVGARWRAPAATASGLLLLVGSAALVTTPGAAAVLAPATGALAVAAASGGRRSSPPAVDARTRLVRLAPLVGVVLAAAPVALLVGDVRPGTSVWAVVGAGVLVAVLLGVAARGLPAREQRTGEG